MEGYLKKWVNIISGWKPRYFILHGGLLTYCEKKGSETKGAIYLKIASISSNETDPLRITINTGTTEVNIRPDTIEEKESWYNALIQAQEEALREDVDKQYPEKDIQIVEGRLSVESKSLLRDSNLDSLKEDLAQLWVKQAEFTETLSLLMPKLAKVSGGNDLTEKLENLGNDLKYQVTLCVQKIELEKKKMVSIMHRYEEQVSRNSSPMKFGGLRQTPLEDRHDYTFNRHDETYFESFYDEEEKDPLQSQYFYYPKENGHLILNLESSAPEGNDILRKQSSPTQRALKSQKSLGSMANFDIESLHPYVKKLLNGNPAFIGTTIPKDVIREKMPHFIDPLKKFSVWEIVKNMVGKDLTRLAVPVFLNEPLSMLQRLCEQLEYAEYLSKANKQKDSCLRMAWCIAFAFSSMYSMIGRMKKPFNPILGETFEYAPVDGSFKFVSEQVSHHPPISAGHAISDDYIWYSDTGFKSSFGPGSLEVSPLGFCHIKLKNNNDHITYKRPTTQVCNLVFGTMYIENIGDMPFQNHTTGDTAVMTMKKRGWNGKGAYEAEGWIKDKNGNLKYKLVGKWDSYLKAIDTSNNKEIMLWEPYPRPSEYEAQYSFSKFTKQLNYLSAELAPHLAPTDCRFRPDQRALEHGNEELAASEKFRLEEKQRARRKQMQAATEVHKPRWFEERTDPLTGDKIYEYMGGYWEARDQGEFKDMLDLFT